MNLELYDPKIRYQNTSVLCGQTDEMIDLDHDIFEIPVLREWLADDDLQEIVVCSTNVGFVKTFTKIFR